MADQTDKLWEVVGEIVKERLSSNPGYDLIICGHSLGGGVACLLTIKLYTENLLRIKKQTESPSSRWKIQWQFPSPPASFDSYDDSPTNTITPKIRCYAYGPPAMFCLDNSLPPSIALEKAISSIVCYIHDDDCVPTISLSYLRSLRRSLENIHYGNSNLLDRFGMILGNDDPPQELVDDVQQASRSGVDAEFPFDETPNETPNENSFLPASRIIWMRGTAEKGYVAYQYHPLDVPGVFVDVDMFEDHKPQQYETSLEQLLVDSEQN